MLKKVNDSKLCISNDLLFKTIAIAVICILFQIEVYSQKIVVRKYKSFRPDSIKGMHGLFYRLPSTRFKVVISGKHIVEKPSKLLKDSLYLQQVLAYPIPFVRKERNENVVESVELIPETVPDRENLFFVEMKSSGVFKNINFSFKSDDQLIPFSSEYSAEGNPITLLVKVADVTIDLLVPGVSPSFSKIERTQAPQFFLGYEDESIPQKAKKVVEEAHVPQISDYVKKDNELSEDIAKVFYEFVEQAPSVSDKEKELPGPALDKELKKLIAPEYSVSDKSITDFSNELIKKWNEGTLGEKVVRGSSQPVVSPLTKAQNDYLEWYNKIITLKRGLLSNAADADFEAKMHYLEREEAKVIRELGGSKIVTDFTLTFYWEPTINNPSCKDVSIGDFLVDISLKDPISADSNFKTRKPVVSGFFYRIPHFTNCTVHIKTRQGNELMSEVTRLCIPQLGPVTWLPKMRGLTRNQNFVLDSKTGALTSITLTKKGLSDEDKAAVGDLIETLPDRKYNKAIEERKRRLELLKANKDLKDFGVNPNAELEDLERENKRLAAILEQIRLKKELEKDKP